MTFERDPDRLIDAWLDEGPRSFSPRLLDRTLADIHGTPQRRRRWASWRIPSMNLAMKTAVAAVLVLAVAIGAGGLLPRLAFGPAASPGASAGPSTSPSPAPTPDFLTGEVDLVGPTWLLVGYSQDGRYVAALAAPVATMAFEADGTLTGTTGCHPLDSSYTLALRRGGPAALASVTVGGIDDFACGEPIDTQDRAVLDHLYHAAPSSRATLTTDGFETLTSGLTEADLDPELLAHYVAWPDLTRLIIRDQWGEGTLIYAPLAGDGPDLSSAPATPTPSGPLPSFLPGDQALPTPRQLARLSTHPSRNLHGGLPSGAWFRQPQATRSGGPSHAPRS